MSSTQMLVPQAVHVEATKAETRTLGDTIDFLGCRSFVLWFACYRDYVPLTGGFGCLLPEFFTKLGRSIGFRSPVSARRSQPCKRKEKNALQNLERKKTFENAP